MFEKILHFIKYNNATVIILAIILILGGGALAAGPEAIGVEQTSIQGVDNNLLLSVDLDNFIMDFKIEKIEAGELYYYATYSYLDLVVLDNAWQYQLNSKTQKISKKIKEDLGEYLVGFLGKHHEARVRQLKSAKRLEEMTGEQARVEVTEYTGLVGKTLDLAAKVFPGYEPVKKVNLATPEFNLPVSQLSEASQPDNLTQIYNNYVAEHPDLFAESASSTPEIVPEIIASSTPEELTPIDTQENVPTTVEIMELPPVEEPAVEQPTVPETAPSN